MASASRALLVHARAAPRNLRPPALLFSQQRARFSDAAAFLSGRVPSEKQLKFAQSLSAEHATPLPAGALTCSMQCSTFIDGVLDSNPTKPSEKQLTFATKLAEENNVPVPEKALIDRRAMSAFIDEMLGSKPGGGGGDGGTSMNGGFMSAENGTGSEPSPKQLGLAAILAREMAVGIPASALVDKRGMSSFIDELMEKRGPSSGSSGGMGEFTDGSPARPPVRPHRTHINTTHPPPKPPGVISTKPASSTAARAEEQPARRLQAAGAATAGWAAATGRCSRPAAAGSRSTCRRRQPASPTES